MKKKVLFFFLVPVFCFVSCGKLMNDTFDLGEEEGTNGSIHWKYDIPEERIVVSGNCDSSNPFVAASLTGIHADRIRIVEMGWGSGTFSLGDYAFCAFSNLKKVTIGSNVITAGRNLFDGLELDELNIYADTSGWDEHWSDGCNRIPSDLTTWKWVISGDILYFTGTGEIYKYSSSWSSLYFTKVIVGSGITGIGSHTFENCTSMTSIELPATVSSIGYSAFSNCMNLTVIGIPSSITAISSYAFNGWTSAQTITLGWTSYDTTVRSLDGLSSYSTAATIKYSDGTIYYSY